MMNPSDRAMTMSFIPTTCCWLRWRFLSYRDRDQSRGENSVAKIGHHLRTVRTAYVPHCLPHFDWPKKQATPAPVINPPPQQPPAYASIQPRPLQYTDQHFVAERTAYLYQAAQVESKCGCPENVSYCFDKLTGKTRKGAPPHSIGCPLRRGNQKKG